MLLVEKCKYKCVYQGNGDVGAVDRPLQLVLYWN